MGSTFLSGGVATRRSRRGIRYSYIACATIALLALLVAGTFVRVGLSSAAGAVVPAVAIPQSPFASSCPSPVFGPATNFGTRPGPQSVAGGDFNRDGNPDLAAIQLLLGHHIGAAG